MKITAWPLADAVCSAVRASELKVLAGSAPAPSSAST
jgi:hypothetical protein